MIPTRNAAVLGIFSYYCDCQRAPDSIAVRKLGKMMRSKMRPQPAPRDWAASVRERTLMEASPLSTARYMYGNVMMKYAPTSRVFVPVMVFVT